MNTCCLCVKSYESPVSLFLSSHASVSTLPSSLRLFRHYQANCRGAADPGRGIERSEHGRLSHQSHRHCPQLCRGFDGNQQHGGDYSRHPRTSDCQVAYSKCKEMDRTYLKQKYRKLGNFRCEKFALITFNNEN